MRKRTKNQRQREMAARVRSRDSALRRRRERADGDSVVGDWIRLPMALPRQEGQS